MPRRCWDPDSTFSARHRASFPFRQRISNLIQTGIFARLTHSRKSDLGCRRALVWGLILALAGTTGSSMNPARDLSSRIAHTILPIPGKGSSDWGYAPISVLGTLVGGVLGGLAFRLLHV